MLEFREVDNLHESISYDTWELVNEDLICEYTIDEIRTALRAGPVLLRFTKKTTGTRRNMYCTTKMDMIPADQHPKGTGSPSRDPNHIRVYDLIKKAWRSFIVQNIHPGKFKPGDIGFLDKTGMKLTGGTRDSAFKQKEQPKPEEPIQPKKRGLLQKFSDFIKGKKK